MRNVEDGHDDVLARADNGTGLIGAWPRSRPDRLDGNAGGRGQNLGGGRPADAALAAAHAEAGERLQAVDVGHAAGGGGIANGSGVDSFAPADHDLVGHVLRQGGGTGRRLRRARVETVRRVMRALSVWIRD